MCSSKTLSPRLTTSIQVIFIPYCTCWHAWCFSKRTYCKKTTDRPQPVPTYKNFVPFYLCTSQNKLKTKITKNNIRVAENTSHSKNGAIFKRWQKWPFSATFQKSVIFGILVCFLAVCCIK